MSDDLIVFTAALQGASCIKLDGDGGGKITLTVPDSEKEAFRRLMDCRRQILVVTIGVANRTVVERTSMDELHGR